MTLKEYIESKRSDKKIPASIRGRWQSRVVVEGLKGKTGAKAYLTRYGKNIKAPKLILLARQAENTGDSEMAETFWVEAYALETGEFPTETEYDAPITIAPEKVWVEDLPMQPGEVVTMQPVDAKMTLREMIESDYWAQRKVYGHRLVLFATERDAYYQSRSSNLRPRPSDAFHNTLVKVAGLFGSFILDGEIYYTDVNGKEYLTESEAAQNNAAIGRNEAPTHPHYAVFRALAFDGVDLSMESDRVRLEYGAYVGALLSITAPNTFEFLTPYTTPESKAILVQENQEYEREGEVWFLPDAPYMPGKNGKYKGRTVTVRTKYRQTYDVMISALPESDKEGRLFSAIQTERGGVGTGFTREQQKEIHDAFWGSEDPVIIEVSAQGLTTNGMFIHGSFERIRK